MTTASSNTVKRLKPAASARRARRGLTLIELVMVVALLGLLATLAIPGVQMAVEGRAIREAARSVNVFLGSARNRAMTTGRPVGVAFQRFSAADPYDNMCITLHQIETAPPYAGETMSSRARVYFESTTVLKAQLSDGAATTGKVQKGDHIQFNHQGPWYKIKENNSGLLTLAVEFLADGITPKRIYPWPNALADAEFMPYEIHCQPQVPDTVGPRRAAFSKPLQLPLDAVVDLTFSGLPANATDTQGHFSVANAASTGPVVVVFSPNGGLEGVYYGLTEVQNQPVYLLIGKRERIPAGSADDGRSNLRDPECLWVTVSPRSGLINTVENAEVAADTEIAAARIFTDDQQSMGGR